MNWVAPLPWANSFMSPEVLVIVANLPRVKPKYGERNWAKFHAGTPKMPPGGSGRVWLVFTGINAPVFRLTDRAQLPSSSKLKNPPGHRPSFWLSRFIVRSPRPPYCQAPLLPPLTTPCPIWVTFRSMVTPFSAHSLRRPPQSPVKVERDQRSPEYGSFGVVSCARTVAPR